VPSTRLIRRYGNRKLYDVEGRRYVTLEELSDLVGRGHEVQVVDQRTREDLTNLTLAQMILDAVRESTARVPRPVLVRLVRLAKGPASAWGQWISPQEAATRARDEVERVVGALLARGRLSLEEGLALRQELARSVHGIVAEAQSGVVDKLRHLLPAGDVSHLGELKGRLDTLATYLKKPARTRSRAGKGRAKRPSIA
jgi:polyhydroxyalkanoate synthesis repressor PhaR